MGKGIGVDL